MLKAVKIFFHGVLSFFFFLYFYHFTIPVFEAIIVIENMYMVGFVALCPKSTAMVIAGRSVHLTTLFPGQA